MGHAFATPAAHHTMLRDHVRMMAYRAAIFAAARDKVVVDLGCGSGVLSIFAAQAGARHVYAIEETKIAALAALMFEANGCADRITLLRGNSHDLELPERAQLLVHEIIGADPFDENILPILADARRRLLAPDGIFLPDAMEVFCVGVEIDDVPGPTERMVQEAEQLQHLYGVNFAPYILAIEAYRDALAVGAEPSRVDKSSRVLTGPCRLRSVRFAEETPLHELPAELEIAGDGMLGGLVIYFRAQLHGGVELSNAPFAPATSWTRVVRDLPRRRAVRQGERIPLRSRIEAIDGRQRILIDL
jgi:protein arginine N-methyltransferase 1